MLWWHRTRAALGAVGATVVAVLLSVAGGFGIAAIWLAISALDATEPPPDPVATVAAGAFVGGALLLAASLLGLLLYFAAVMRGAGPWTDPDRRT